MAASVLVVDDEPLIRLGLQATLESAGFEVLEAVDADDAISILEREEGIRIVVTDINMPGTMDGLKLAAFVHGRWPPIRLILMSGKAKPSPSEMPAGAMFLSKPYGDRQLVRLVESMTASGQQG